MRRTIKRLIDLPAATVILLLFSPLLLVVAVLIKLTSRGPVFFRQDRLGYRGVMFRVFKFRTMVVDAEKLGTIVGTSDSRITGIGWYLRKYRIDELPQLINVLRGDMSLVGPRPLVPLHAHTWTTEERKRLNMPPGMTGWQQVNGGATNTWEERIALDVWYVEHWSLWLDFLILMRTPWVVLRANTVYGADGQERSSIPTRTGEQPIEASSATSSNAPSAQEMVR